MFGYICSILDLVKSECCLHLEIQFSVFVCSTLKNIWNVFSICKVLFYSMSRGCMWRPFFCLYRLYVCTAHVCAVILHVCTCGWLLDGNRSFQETPNNSVFEQRGLFPSVAAHSGYTAEWDGAAR